MHYEKAFDSVVQTQAILTSLQEKGIEDVCIEILFKIHIHGQLSKVHKESESLRIKRGVRQETPSHPICSQQYSPRALFRRLNWENKGVHQGGGDCVPDSITHLLSIIFFNVDDFHVSVQINI